MTRRAFALAVLLALAGCASPDTAYYTLRAVPGRPVGGGPASVQIRRPGLAGYLDRPEIVRDSSNYRLRLNSGERWGEPLGDMFGRVLAENLAQRLPGTSVFTGAGAISADPAATVEIDVQRFDLDVGNTAVLLVQAAVQRGRAHDPSAARSIRLTLPVAGSDTQSLVAAEGQLLGQLADSLAKSLRTVATPPDLQPTKRRR